MATTLYRPVNISTACGHKYDLSSSEPTCVFHLVSLSSSCSFPTWCIEGSWIVIMHLFSLAVVIALFCRVTSAHGHGVLSSAYPSAQKPKTHARMTRRTLDPPESDLIPINPFRLPQVVRFVKLEDDLHYPLTSTSDPFGDYQEQKYYFAEHIIELGRQMRVLREQLRLTEDEQEKMHERERAWEETRPPDRKDLTRLLHDRNDLLQLLHLMKWAEGNFNPSLSTELKAFVEPWRQMRVTGNPTFQMMNTRVARGSVASRHH